MVGHLDHRPAAWPSDPYAHLDLLDAADGDDPPAYGTSSTGYGGANVTFVTLSVTHHRDGSFTASCHVGDA